MARTQQIASPDITPQQPPPIVFGSADDLADSVEKISPVDGPQMTELAELEKFMNEPVTFMILPSESEHAEKAIHCSINGEPPLLNRDRTPNFWITSGVPVTVKRKFLARLAQTKKTNYRQNFSQPTNQSMVNTLIPQRGCAYPIQLIRDDNPNGARHLQKWLEE